MNTLELLKKAEVKHNKRMKELDMNRPFKPSIKYFKRLDLFKASNVTFDPKTTEAHSYDWWSFVKVINGKVVFNDYSYSSSTRKHQYKVSSLMRELGIKIDLEIEAPKGLRHKESAIPFYESKIADIQALMNNPKSRKKTNIKRLKQIKEYKNKIKLVQSLFSIDELLSLSVK